MIWEHSIKLFYRWARWFIHTVTKCRKLTIDSLNVLFIVFGLLIVVTDYLYHSEEYNVWFISTMAALGPIDHKSCYHTNTSWHDSIVRRLSLPFKSELIQFHRERADICYISGLMLSQGSLDYAMISHFRCIPAAEIASFYFRDVIWHFFWF